MKVAAVIVTCNRKQQLCDLLDDFMNQKQKVDGIFVIDNASEDGTVEHVKINFPFVQMIELENNSGQFGGQEIGVKTALEQGYDAVWLVDDDARLDVNAFWQLMNAVEMHDEIRKAVIWSSNITPEDKYFTEPVCVKVEGEWKTYNKFLPELNDKIYETGCGPNIGIYIHRSVIEHVGPPRADMVFCGEGEFITRVQDGGFKLFRCFSSVLYHKRHMFHEVKFLGRTRFVCKTTPWHTYYEMRNRIFIDMEHGKRTVLKSLVITAIDSVGKIYICDKKISTAFYILKAIFDGFRRKTGMRVTIPRLISEKQK